MNEPELAREKQMTVRQAADLLNVSESTLAKMIASHQISHVGAGPDCRITLQAIASFEERTHRYRMAGMESLAQESVTNGSMFVVPDSFETR